MSLSFQLRWLDFILVFKNLYRNISIVWRNEIFVL